MYVSTVHITNTYFCFLYYSVYRYLSVHSCCAAYGPVFPFLCITTFIYTSLLCSLWTRLSSCLHCSVCRYLSVNFCCLALRRFSLHLYITVYIDTSLYMSALQCRGTCLYFSIWRSIWTPLSTNLLCSLKSRVKAFLCSWLYRVLYVGDCIAACKQVFLLSCNPTHINTPVCICLLFRV
jgi:hypothetical protein